MEGGRVIRQWTYLEMVTKVENDMDLAGEEFITATEMLGLFNEAIDEVEAAIHNLNEDYFLARQFLSLEADTEDIALPDDIYASKIRSIIYLDTDTNDVKYEIKRIKGWKEFLKYRIQAALAADQADYKYFLTNDNVSDGVQIIMAPPPGDDGLLMEIWYIRNANRMTVDADVCDIPEFTHVVLNKVKEKVAMKEGHPRLDLFREESEKTWQQMLETLAEKTPDGDNDIEPDMSFYEDMA